MTERNPKQNETFSPLFRLVSVIIEAGLYLLTKTIKKSLKPKGRVQSVKI